MTTILFQGDSLTDAGRSREGIDLNRRLGCGYANLIAARLMCDNPAINVYNTACSGDRAADMYGRWIEDTLNIDFDILSVLLGINDIGFEIRMKRGADAKKFEFIYDRMIYEVFEQKPNSKLVLCEPFIFKLELDEVENSKDIIENWQLWNGHMVERQAIVKNLADKYHAVYVPFGDMFKQACKDIPAKHWSFDGIHATSAGHELMARKWLECVLPALG